MKKKILIIQQYFYPDISAVSQLLGDLLVEYQKQYHGDVDVLTSSITRPFSNGCKVKRYGNIRIIRMPTILRKRKDKVSTFLQIFIFHLLSFFYLLFCFNYSIVVSMTSPPLIGFTASLAMRIKKRFRFIYYVEDVYPELLIDSKVIKKPYILKKLSIFNRLTFRVAEKVIVISRFMRKKLINNYQVKKKKLNIIENWALGIAFSPPKFPPKLQIMYSGNLGYAHDFSLLQNFIDAVEPLPLNFRFIGAGRKLSSVKKVFDKNRSISCSFEKYVPIEEHNATLAEANFYLLAQDDKTVGDILPSKLYSYLAAGRPIIFLGPYNCEIGLLISENEIGAVIEIEEDVLNSAAFIKRCIQDHSYYLEVCTRVRGIYKKNGGVDRAAFQFENVLIE